MPERVQAVCDPCGTRYRVPDATKTYACKACDGGRVRAKVKEDVTMTQERAESPGDRPARTGRRERASRPVTTDDDAREAAGRTVRFVQVAFVVHVVLSATSLYAFLARDDVAWSTGVYAAIALVLATQTAVALVGALNARWSPLACAGALAGLWILGKALRVAGGEPFAPDSAFAVVDLGVGLALLATLLPAAGAQRALARFPDLYAAEHDAPAASLRGTAAMRVTSALRAREEARARTRFRTGVAVAGLYAVAGAATWAVHAANRMEQPAAALDRLREAWGSASVDVLAAEFDEARRDDARARLVERLEPHGWTAWPSLRMTSLENDLERLTASFDVGLEHGELSAVWRADGAAWHLEELRLPPPALGPLAEAFARAWNREDLDAVVATFHLDDAGPTKRELRGLLADRGWTEDWPAVRSLDTVAYRAAEGTAEQTMTLETDAQLAVTWRLVDGRWRVHSLRPPAR